MKHLIRGIAALLLALVASVGAAQNYPNRPIRVVVPFGTGSGGDILARIIADRLTVGVGQPFIVDNRPGASGTIGAQLAFSSAPDGYTLVLSSTGMAITASAYQSLKYDTAAFTSVTVITHSPLGFAANPSFTAKTVPEFIAYAKANPGKVSYGSLGIATSHHVTGEKLKMDAGIDMVHVPYKGSGAAHTDLIGGHIQVMFDNIVALMPHFKSGRLHPLAVSSLKRHRLLPDVPSLAEAGVKGFEAVTMIGFAAPPGTPKDVIARLNAEVVKVLAIPEVRQRLLETGFDVIGDSPEDADRYFKAEIARWGVVIKAANIRLTD